MSVIARLNAEIEEMAAKLGLRSAEAAVDTGKSVNLKDRASHCLLLTGDNFKALSHLLLDRQNKVDFIYIDPPYNTGQEFAYSDNRRGSLVGIWREHHDWLAFMLPRIVASRNLLAADGIIAISIDDYEYANLKVLMDNIYGEKNYIATLVVCRSKNGRGSKLHVAVNHEYVLLYGKSDEIKLNGLLEGESRTYDKSDEHGEYTVDGLFRKKGAASRREDRPNMFYPLYYSKDGRVFTERVSDELAMVLPQDSQGVERRWLWGQDKATQESWKLYASPKGVIYVKNYNRADKRAKLRSLLDRPEYLTDRATTELKELFGEKIFETPKPIGLIQDLIDACVPSDASVLDFFAGTGTTAEAAWRLNKRDGGTRTVTLIEAATAIPTQHAAEKAGFATLADLTAFRLEAIRAKDSGYRYEKLSIE